MIYKLVECSPNVPNGLLPQKPITSLVYYLYKITMEMFAVEKKKIILLIKLHIFKFSSDNAERMKAQSQRLPWEKNSQSKATKNLAL